MLFNVQEYFIYNWEFEPIFTLFCHFYRYSMSFKLLYKIFDKTILIYSHSVVKI